MADADGPGRPGRVPPANEQVAARIDREAGKRGKLFGGKVDGESLGHGTEVEHEGPPEQDRLPRRIEANVTIGADGSRNETRIAALTGAEVLVEAVDLHLAADSRVESTPGFAGHRKGELDDSIEEGADGDRDANAPGKRRQFAVRIESTAARLYVGEPPERTPGVFLASARRGLTISIETSVSM